MRKRGSTVSSVIATGDNYHGGNNDDVIGDNNYRRERQLREQITRDIDPRRHVDGSVRNAEVFALNLHRFRARPRIYRDRF